MTESDILEEKIKKLQLHIAKEIIKLSVENNLSFSSTMRNFIIRMALIDCDFRSNHSKISISSEIKKFVKIIQSIDVECILNEKPEPFLSMQEEG